MGQRQAFVVAHAGLGHFQVAENARRAFDDVVHHVATVANAHVVCDVASDQTVGANEPEEAGQQLVRRRAVVAVEQYDLAHFAFAGGLDGGVVAQANQVLGVLAAAWVTHQSLANFERVEASIAQAVDDLDGGDVGVALGDAIVRGQSGHAGCVVSNLLVAQRGLATQGFLGR